MSETAASRSVLAPYCLDPCIDIGFGGTAVTERAITFDMPQPYCPSLEGHQQILRGDARRLPFICDGAMASVYSSHLVEDFSYDDLVKIIGEWRRILRVGGNLVVNAPDQQRFLSWCKKTGQGLNLAHHEQDFSLANFKTRVLANCGPWEEVFEMPDDGKYSWYLVVRKLDPSQVPVEPKKSKSLLR